MAGMRSILTVDISLGLFGFPTSVYKGSNDPTGGIEFKSLHGECGTPINQIKRCAKCEKEVHQADLVKGFPHNGSFLQFTDAEVKALKPTAAGVCKISGYLAADEIDPCYIDGSVYFLKPGGKDDTTFTTWRDALNGRWGVGSLVMYGREHVVAIRKLDRVLAMHTVRTHAEIRNVADVPGYDKITEQATAEHLDMMDQLMSVNTIAFDDVVLESDSYVDAVKAMIAARAAGNPLPENAPVAAPAGGMNIMAAMRASIAARMAAQA